MDGKRHHLRDILEACDSAVVGRFLPVATLDDQDGSPFEVPAVLLVPHISRFPSSCPIPIFKLHFYCRASDVTDFSISAALALFL